MKMRRRVIVKIHLNAAAVEPDDRGHKSYASAYLALVQEDVDVRRPHQISSTSGAAGRNSCVRIAGPSAASLCLMAPIATGAAR